MQGIARGAWHTTMKSPDDIAETLTRQWLNADKREQRLLDPNVWPVELSIGRPSPSLLTHHTAQVREHIRCWREVSVGRVEWEDAYFRSAAEPISLPVKWLISSPEEWAHASADELVRLELPRLRYLIDQIDVRFHPLLVRQRGLWRDRDIEEIVLATKLALELAPGIAAGGPLRSIALAGIDTKFIERNEGLLTALLDVRFEGQVSEQGLAGFLNAADEGNHWLLVAPLSPGLLPFAQQRVRAKELMNTPLPAKRILLVENDRCLHRLPSLPGVVAVLGSGLDLAWLSANWLSQCCLRYWGDMDTWGLHMLARARALQPHLEPLLMNRDMFCHFEATLAVKEPATAGIEPPDGLTDEERDFYQYLLGREKGRIEQEFLPLRTVEEAFFGWSNEL